MKLLLDGKDYYHDFSFWKYLQFAAVFLLILVFDIFAFPKMNIEQLILTLGVEGMILFFVGIFTIGGGPAQVRQIRFFDKGVKFHAQGLDSKEKYLPYTDISKVGLLFYAHGWGVYSECEIKTASSYERVRLGFWSPFGFKRFVRKVKALIEEQGFEEVDPAEGSRRSIYYVFEKR